MTASVRPNNRTPQQIRPITIHYDVYGYADASVLWEQGNTKVLIGISLQQTVPPFLKGQRTGWLSAEYAMLPTATQQRTLRESSQSQRNSRSVEISRLIGRCLRTSVDLAVLGERSIMIDCDVLQADGGTRVACISAASMALKIACHRWLTAGFTQTNVFTTSLAALSAGIVNGIPVVDLEYTEDNKADADFNFIFTEQGLIVEIQGTCEKAPISTDLFEQLKLLALDGTKEIFKQCGSFPLPENQPLTQSPQLNKSHDRQSFFSLANRLGKGIETK